MARLKPFTATLDSAVKIYLDTSCFIYHFATHPEYSPLTAALFSRLESGAVTGLTSTLTITETFVLPEKKASVFEMNAYEQFFLYFPHLSLQAPTYPVTRLGAKLRAQYSSLRTPDAVHLSTALFHQAGAFITNDRRFQVVKELPLIILGDYLA